MKPDALSSLSSSLSESASVEVDESKESSSNAHMRIYQTTWGIPFTEEFRDLWMNLLNRTKTLGFTHIQISPIQQNGEITVKRPDVVDKEKIRNCSKSVYALIDHGERLRSDVDRAVLTDMVTQARKLDLEFIGDSIFNHSSADTKEDVSFLNTEPDEQWNDVRFILRELPTDEAAGVDVKEEFKNKWVRQTFHLFNSLGMFTVRLDALSSLPKWAIEAIGEVAEEELYKHFRFIGEWLGGAEPEILADIRFIKERTYLTTSIAYFNPNSHQLGQMFNPDHGIQSESARKKAYSAGTVASAATHDTPPLFVICAAWFFRQLWTWSDHDESIFQKTAWKNREQWNKYLSFLERYKKEELTLEDKDHLTTIHRMMREHLLAAAFVPCGAYSILLGDEFANPVPLIPFQEGGELVDIAASQVRAESFGMDLRGTIQQINAVSCCLDASLKNDQFEPKIFAIGDRNEIYVVLRLHKNMKGHVENMEIIPFNVETGMLEPMTFETMREKMQRKLDSSLGEEEKVYLRGLYNGCLAENVKFNRLIVIPDEVA